MEHFYGKLAEILEVNEVRNEEVLKDFEAWDSLTILSIIAMADSDYKVTLSAKDLDNVETVGDLKTYLENHKK
jgi:acyl carrier protein